MKPHFAQMSIARDDEPEQSPAEDPQKRAKNLIGGPACFGKITASGNSEWT